MQGINLSIFAIHRELENLDVYLLLQKPVIVDFFFIMFQRMYHNSPSPFHIVNVKEKAVESNINERVFAVSSLLPKRCSRQIASTPILLDKIISQLICTSVYWHPIRVPLVVSSKGPSFGRVQTQCAVFVRAFALKQNLQTKPGVV
jgi:hypothetical protein